MTIVPKCDNYWFDFLFSKQKELLQICIVIREFNDLLNQQDSEDRQIDIHLEFVVDMMHGDLIFRVMRRERHNYYNTETSFIVLSEYRMTVERNYDRSNFFFPHSDIRTFGKIPSKGFWTNIESENFYSNKGLGKLLWHITVFAASLLKMQRKVIPAADQTKKWVSEYEKASSANNYEIKQFPYPKTFMPSPSLTGYAYKLAKERLKKVEQLKRMETQSKENHSITAAQKLQIAKNIINNLQKREWLAPKRPDLDTDVPELIKYAADENVEDEEGPPMAGAGATYTSKVRSAMKKLLLELTEPPDF